MTKFNISKRLLPIPVMLIVFFLIFYFAYTDIKQRTIKEFNNEQFILAQTASQGITSYFDEAQSDLAFLAQTKDIVEFKGESDNLMAGFYEYHKDLLEAITRVDAHGIIMYTYPSNNSVIGKDISYQKHVRQVIDTQKPVISDVFISVQGYLAIALHVPVFKGKEYKGSLALLIPIDKIGKKYLDKIKIRGTGNIWLLSENGVEIYCPVSGHKGKTFLDNTRNELATVELMKKIKSNTSGTANSIHKELVVDGETTFEEKYMVFYRAPIRNTYWTILISYQEEDVYKALAQLRNRLILTFLLLFLFVSYYFYSIAKVRNVLREEEKRRMAEAKLRETEIQYQNLANSSPALIWTSGTDKLCNYFNLTWLAFTGRTLEQEMGNGWAEGVHPDDFDRCLETYVTAFDSHESFEMEYRLKHNSGEYRWLLDLGTPNYNSNGEFVGFIGNCFDISDRKRAEDEILMLAQSLKSVNECVSITDMEDKILFVNDSFLNTYGYAAEEVLGKHLGFIRSENNAPEIISEVLPTTMKGRWSGELLNLRKDGSEFPVYLSTSSVKDKDGKIISLIGVASDITERKRNEEELVRAKEKAEESDRLKSAFLANMSHEIRTPMNGILGFSELLKMPGLTGDQQQEYIDMIKKSGKRMLNIINDIVDISKIESGQMEVSFSETPINKQLEFVYSFFKHEADQKGIELSYETGLSSETSIINTDKEKVYAILINLVKNAIKYSDTGAIKLGYILKGANLEFYVKDTGIGIPKDRIHAIFDRFVQADIADSRAYQGAGLGLSISKAYVEMLGGKIWVESEEGKGSTFYFAIPYSFVNSEIIPAITPDRVISEAHPGKSLKILIAEDDEASEMLIALAVKEFGNRIIKVSTGVDAVEVCRSNPDIDLVLMDIQMPLMNGYEATKQIRQFNMDLIIIAQTAYGLAGDREKALEAGCDDYISKPIDIKALNELIKKHFQ